MAARNWIMWIVFNRKYEADVNKFAYLIRVHVIIKNIPIINAIY